MVQLYLSLIDDEQDQIRFEEAYYEYKTLMHFIANDILHDMHRAEDAVQEAFIRIAKNFHKVGDIKDNRTKNLFILITRRVAFNMMEREESFTTATENEINRFENEAAIDDTFIPFHKTELMMAILRLPESYRSVLYLQAVYGFDGKETASLLGISVDAVWKRTSRARAALEKELSEK